MRVLFSAPIHVSGKDSKNRDFDEDTRTLVVNAHGALISLGADVVPGQHITLSNRATRQSRLCRIVNVRAGTSQKTPLGIEFLTPSPAFWQLDFPPDDWFALED